MEKMTLVGLAEVVKVQGQTIVALEQRIKELEDKLANVQVRDRGPSSTRKMTEEDARRIMIGDLKKESHKKAAEVLGLSYGQIYSARGGYTFKEIFDEANKK